MWSWMAQMSGMMAQISDLSAKVHLGSSALTQPASSSVAQVTLVKPDMVQPVTSSAVTQIAMVKSLGRLAHSSVEALASTVKYQPSGVESDGEVALFGEYLSSSGPESTHAHSGPLSTVTGVLPSAKVDSTRTVLYDSGQTDPI